MVLDAIPQSVPYPWPLAGRWQASQTALIVIDMQRDFLADGGYFQSLGEDLTSVRQAIEPGKQMLELARKLGMTVIMTRESHRPDLADLNPNKRLKGERLGAAPGMPGPMGRLLVRGEYGCDMIDEFQPMAGELVLDKPGNSAFYATDLGHMLQARGIKQLIIQGVTTDVCVSSTLRDANDRGYDCLVIRDACGAASQSLHDSVFASMEREGGIFGAYTDVAALLQDLAGQGC
ncbi:cysteine hydrolase family protein [Oceanobacter mangrovi]|uniref:cysteine hydrolase family protein n=1 Tax=Oceanobacter mangrovi TaxID=2862510 RepID=UPI001C8D5A5E|nr:isochorismatase family cysteine hydrolase [Oceanobacter mangrovi]